MTYSFCESVYATGRSPWHIRRLTDAGVKLTGGIDTHSLCGVVKTGWDIRAPISSLPRYAEVDVICVSCLKAFNEERS